MGVETKGAGHDVIVIGGGAAGMLAAGSAGEGGARVLLLERNARLGRKLGITGDGRCNLTNTDGMDEFIKAFGPNGRFLYRAFSAFTNRDLIAFFDGLGVATKEEDGGRIFPARGGAKSVIGALERYMEKHGVEVMLNARASEIRIDPASGAIAGVALADRGTPLGAMRVVLATGGLSYPATGSTGDGYTMARALGHTIVPPRPALVPLETVESFPARLRGVSLADVAVTAMSGRKKIASESGDMLFTHYGVSGPVVLALSGVVVERLGRDEEVVLSVNLMPRLDASELDALLVRTFAVSGRKRLATAMGGFVPKALAVAFLDGAEISGAKPCAAITAAERKRLGALLSDMRLTVKRARPIAEAIVTRGGIDLKEVDPRNME